MTTPRIVDWLQRLFESLGISRQVFKAQAITDGNGLRWGVQFDKIEVTFDTTHDGHEMWWTAKLGQPRPAEAQALFHAMLIANVDREFIPHTNLAIDPTSGDGLLIARVDSLDNSDDDYLTQRLEQFINAAAMWIGIIEGNVANCSDTGSEQTEDTVPTDAIRV